ncbi:serine/threonine-protein kinase [Gloeobacter violaceus]|uniref:non-specific serine/threonine protein kinase n=1 Tax=Gloeobacter violaceus (strain ATCC 29082 / PCC 7421) TaxID=251221 RepID=Q7NKC6_GLOVI|nr:serine/threonine-protein kinase [Gloeobacter violaceus]BAC89493.1 serine/threonine kinase [Gloeobacter violaceus PCC 7421]
MIGRLLDGRYKILQILGAGGFSQTYLALDTRRPSSPTCVVKHLKPTSENPGSLQIARRLFRSEAETLERIGHHDQIPRLLAYFEEDEEFYLVQEFIEGHVLATELQPDAPMGEARVAAMLQDVLSTLAFVHSQGVIHRDVKPDNLIRRSSDGKLVLVDFGAVKTVWSRPAALPGGQRGGTVAGTIIGTPGYMSTEQGRGKPRPSSDIYALGMIGIQALTGLNPMELPEDSRTGEPLWQDNAQASPGLCAILSKMVSYHFKDRYQTAHEALEALQHLYASPGSTSAATVERTPPPLEAPQAREETYYGQPLPVEMPVLQQTPPPVETPQAREETYYGQRLPLSVSELPPQTASASAPQQVSPRRTLALTGAVLAAVALGFLAYRSLANRPSPQLSPVPQAPERVRPKQALGVPAKLPVANPALRDASKSAPQAIRPVRPPAPVPTKPPTAAAPVVKTTAPPPAVKAAPTASVRPKPMVKDAAVQPKPKPPQNRPAPVQLPTVTAKGPPAKTASPPELFLPAKAPVSAPETPDILRPADKPLEPPK